MAPDLKQARFCRLESSSSGMESGIESGIESGMVSIVASVMTEAGVSGRAVADTNPRLVTAKMRRVDSCMLCFICDDRGLSGFRSSGC